MSDNILIDNNMKLLRDTSLKSKEDLKNWLLYWLNIDLPDCIVDSEYSDCTPLDMVWMVYESALYSQKLNNFLFIGNRGGSKTLSAAVIEFLLLIHDKRDVTHIGAIEKQAKRAYQYFQGFFRENAFKEFVDRMVMEKTVVKDRGTFEILPCTLAAVNGPHTPIVCVHGDAMILIDNKDMLASNKNRDKVLIKASQVYMEIIKGKELKAISYNHDTKKTESKRILSAYSNGKRSIIKIVKESGNPLRCTLSHKVYVKGKNKYIKASEINIGDFIVSTISLRGFSIENLFIKPVYEKVIKTIKEEKAANVYDFTVEDNHNYFADNTLVHNCRDEIDTVQDIQAYNDIKGIPTQMKDGRPPIEIGISTRKTAFGLSQREVEKAKETGLSVFKWGILEVTERCPDSRSGKYIINIYVDINELEAVHEDEWKTLPHKEQIRFSLYEGYKGCLTNCKLFPACRGFLKNQKCKSKYLRTIELTQRQVLSSSTEWTNAQHLCIKPSPKGLVYGNFREDRSIKTYKEMLEVILDKTVRSNDVTLDDFVTIVEGIGFEAVMGQDFGFTNPAVSILVYIDKNDNIFIAKEFAVTGMDGAELAYYLKNNWLSKFSIETVYADIENPGNIKLLKKAGFICASAQKDSEGIAGSRKILNKDVKGGIETVRGFIKVPGKNKTKLYVHPSCKLFLEEIRKYHYKVDRSGNVISDEPEKAFDHCLSGNTLISTCNGEHKIKDLIGKEGEVFCYSLKDSKIVTSKFYDAHCSGRNRPVYRVDFNDGNFIDGTKEHKVLLKNKEYKRIKDLKKGDSLMPFYRSYDENEVENVSFIGCQDVYDMAVPIFHNFSANGLIVHNSLDSLRYVLHSRFGHRDVSTSLELPEEQKYNDSLLTAPTVSAVVKEAGISFFNDNEEEYENIKKEIESKRKIKTHLGVDLVKEKDKEEDDGFSFIF